MPPWSLYTPKKSLALHRRSYSFWWYKKTNHIDLPLNEWSFNCFKYNFGRRGTCIVKSMRDGVVEDKEWTTRATAIAVGWVHIIEVFATVWLVMWRGKVWDHIIYINFRVNSDLNSSPPSQDVPLNANRSALIADVFSSSFFFLVLLAEKTQEN